MVKVVHRVQPRTTRGERLLRSFGWKDGDAVMLVAESDAHWESVAPAIRANDLTDLMVHRKYTRAELDSAAWLDMSLWQTGYPQPEDGFAYKGLTYHDVCSRCGSKGEQRAPFCMAGEPRWGTRSIMSLHWEYDAVFVKPEVFDEVFEPLGFRSREVHDRRRSILKTVVQVEITERVPLDVRALKGRTCRACGRRRFSPEVLGDRPRLLAPPTSDLSSSREHFGEGLAYFALTIASARLYRALQAAKVRGAEFSVQRLSEAAEGT